jgi:hypothetical protein
MVRRNVTANCSNVAMSAAAYSADFFQKKKFKIQSPEKRVLRDVTSNCSSVAMSAEACSAKKN